MITRTPTRSGRGFGPSADSLIIRCRNRRRPDAVSLNAAALCLPAAPARWRRSCCASVMVLSRRLPPCCQSRCLLAAPAAYLLHYGAGACSLSLSAVEPPAIRPIALLRTHRARILRSAASRRRAAAGPTHTGPARRRQGRRQGGRSRPTRERGRRPPRQRSALARHATRSALALPWLAIKHCRRCRAMQTCRRAAQTCVQTAPAASAAPPLGEGGRPSAPLLAG